MGADQRPEELINSYAKARKGARNIASALGFLALLWSTVVLLGGFVSVLTMKDFCFVTFLSFIMASKLVTFADTKNGGIYLAEKYILHGMRTCEVQNSIVLIRIMSIIVVGKRILIFCLAILFGLSPHVCFVLSLVRLLERDYGDADGNTVNKAKLDMSLGIFYALVSIQLASLQYWGSLTMSSDICIPVSKRCGFGDWGPNLVWRYREATQENLKNDEPLPKDWNLVIYGVGLLESAYLDDRLSGARVLDTFLEQGIVVREELLCSRQSIQNLITICDSTSTVHNSEIRERAARILAHLASDIHTTQFPGTLGCACSLLESHSQYGRADFDKKSSNVALETSEQSSHQEGVHLALVITDQTDHQQVKLPRSGWYVRLIHIFKKKFSEQTYSRLKYSYTFVPKGTKELIFQGLLIVERLTQDQDNCTAICSHPRLLSKITSPIMSYQDLHSNVSDQTWVGMLTRSLTVLSRLIISHGDGASRLRHRISDNPVAVRNLMGILESGSEEVQELREQALEILTELAFDDSFREQTFDESSTDTSITAKFIQILERILFEDEDGSAVVANQDMVKHKRLTRKAGEALARLLDIPSAIGTTDALKSENNADQHHREHMLKMLTKVLHKLLSSKIETATEAMTEDVASNGSVVETVAKGKPPLQDAASIQPSTQESEEQSEERNLTAAMLSLAVVICTKYVVSESEPHGFIFFPKKENVVSEDEFAHATYEDAALVKKLKEIIEINQDTKPDCLRIVQLSCQMVIKIAKLKPSSVWNFNEHSFKELLSKALETFSDLHNCMLFAGDDREVTKPVMSLPSLVKEAQKAIQGST